MQDVEELDKVAKGCVCRLAIISGRNQSGNVPKSKSLERVAGYWRESVGWQVEALK